MNWRLPRLTGQLVLGAACCLLLPLSLSAVRVIDESAIPFTAFLSKAEFDQRFPGKEVAELSELEPGWYVIYEHVSLAYYFGPMLLESTGEDYLAELSEIVTAAVEQRPSIQDYRLELSYEPSEPTGESGGSSESAPELGSPPPPPPEPSGFWGFVKRIFGF